MSQKRTQIFGLAKGNGQISGEKMQMLVILDAHLLQLGRYLFITKCEKKKHMKTRERQE